MKARGLALDRFSQASVRPWHRADGRFMIGNAAAEAHPIIGEGISMAMQSAWLLCVRLIAAGRANASADTLQRVGADYARQWRQAFAPRLHLAATLAHLAMKPWLAPIVWPLIDASSAADDRDSARCREGAHRTHLPGRTAVGQIRIAGGRPIEPGRKHNVRTPAADSREGVRSRAGAHSSDGAPGPTRDRFSRRDRSHVPARRRVQDQFSPGPRRTADRRRSRVLC